MPREVTYNNEADWLCARLDGIGASEIGVVCGLSLFTGTSAYDLWMRKVNRVIDTHDKENDDV